tara:strand:- start:19672 stop:21192 length:1521 start_codon:yes stop_codon:yes gene_type:complete
MTSALAAFNGSGTQGTAAICKMHTPDDGDVQSAFWNRNDTTRFLLFGSSIQEIPTSGGQSVGFGGNQIFTVNNDLDCLGDIYAQIELTVNGYTLANNTNYNVDDLTALAHLQPWGLARFISRIEFMVGTQIWQTMEANDLINVLNTELPESAYHNTAFQLNGNYLASGPKALEDPNRGVYLQPLLASVRLPLLSKTLQPPLSKFTDMTEDGYLMAAAPHQQVKIRLSYTHDSSDVFQRFAPTATMTASAWLPQVAPTSASFSWSVKLYAKQQIMCNAERQQLKNMPLGLPKRIKMTQNAQAQVAMTKNTTASAIDLDHFSLYASYLVVSITDLSGEIIGFDNSGTASTDTANWTATKAVTSNLAAATSISAALGIWAMTSAVSSNGYGAKATIGTILDAELLLNSTSVSGVLPGQFLTASAAESLGLYSNLFVQGRQLAHSDSGFFIFPLASHAYDASAVPLNRFDNIRLRIKPSAGTGQTCAVTVTCVGETTALYKGGAASLAMY